MEEVRFYFATSGSSLHDLSTDFYSPLFLHCPRDSVEVGYLTNLLQDTGVSRHLRWLKLTKGDRLGPFIGPTQVSWGRSQRRISHHGRVRRPSPVTEPRRSRRTSRDVVGESLTQSRDHHLYSRWVSHNTPVVLDTKNSRKLPPLLWPPYKLFNFTSYILNNILH